MKRVMVPGVGEGLLLQSTPDPTEPAEELRRREVAKLPFPVWVTNAEEKALAHKVSPILAYLVRVFATSPVGVSDEVLPKLCTIAGKLAGTAHESARIHSGRELRRLLIFTDHVVRRFLAAAMTAKGGAQAARMLRDLPPILTYAEVRRANECVGGLAQETASFAQRAEGDEDLFLLMNAIGFSGTLLVGLEGLLAAMFEALQPATPPGSAGGAPGAPAMGQGLRLATTTAPETPKPKPTGDVIDFDGSMTLDLLNYGCSVYGAARVLAEHSLAGRGARNEVDQAGLACLVAMIDSTPAQRPVPTST
jgi:hypothetical protein